MGYETRLIIGRKFEEEIEYGMTYFSKIAEIDLCKSNFFDTFLDKDRYTERLYFYDGYDKIETDMYGKPLFSVPPAEILEFMKKHNRERYRRYNAAIPLLKSLIKDFQDENLTCILFGH